MKGYRKVAVVGGVAVLSFIGLALGWVSGEQFTIIATTAVGAFAAANSMEHR